MSAKILVVLLAVALTVVSAFPEEKSPRCSNLGGPCSGNFDCCGFGSLGCGAGKCCGETNYRCSSSAQCCPGLRCKAGFNYCGWVKQGEMTVEEEAAKAAAAAAKMDS